MLQDPIYCVFVDLQKAYDSVPRKKLFRVLWGELGIDQGTVKSLYRMYHDIRASVLIGSEYSAPFPMREGVRQGCPASPLVFSLFADRVEQFID